MLMKSSSGYLLRKNQGVSEAKVFLKVSEISNVVYQNQN